MFRYLSEKTTRKNTNKVIYFKSVKAVRDECEEGLFCVCYSKKNHQRLKL